MNEFGWVPVFVLIGVVLLAGVVYLAYSRKATHAVRKQIQPDVGQRREKQNDQYWSEIAARRSTESAAAWAAWKADPTTENLERRRRADDAEIEAIGLAQAAAEDHFGTAGLFRDE